MNEESVDNVQATEGLETSELAEYIVGDSRLVFSEVVFEPGRPFTRLDLLREGQLEAFLQGGHLIRSEE